MTANEIKKRVNARIDGDKAFAKGLEQAIGASMWESVAKLIAGCLGVAVHTVKRLLFS